MTENNNLGSLLHQAINPEETLCLIEFSDGTDTNDYIPTEVLNNPNINAVEWWAQEAGTDYRSIVEGKKKAVNVTAIKKH
jgi:hypothetical protein